ncbi:MAG: Choice-of-anchor protein [Bacteroidota bacterium]|nr:Choice-of-anchor protein [Bacteroidota bacterium]
MLPRDIIQLEYTLNGGINWDTITPNASGLRISWKFPEIESDRCLIRGVQLWPNNIGKTMDLRHRQAVNSAFFNKDGSLIITACKDSCAYIWQSNIGAVLHKLEGHTGAVNWAVISPDEKYAATASEDSTAILWDILKSQKIKTLAAHTDNVRTVCFSPDSKYLVSAGHDGNAIIWDVLTGQIKNTIKASNSQLWFSEFSPSGDYIVMGGIDSYVKFWDMKTETFTKSINTGNGYNSFGAISRDGSKLVTASLFGRAVVWDIAAGDSIAGFSHEDSSKIPPILYADFDKTGDTLLTSSVDRIVKMWCISTNKLVSNFQEHTNTVKTAVFNFDNSRALTASWDGAAKYWNREKRDLQTDSTDCFFSIVKAGAELRNIDFGKVVVSEYKDSIVDFFVINKTNAPYRISNFRLWGAAKDDFIIHNFRADSVIDSGSYLPLEITFKPGVFGARQAFIDITIPGDSVLHCSITGEGTDYELGIDAPVIDFANTTLGDVKDTIVYPLLTNKINSPLNIYSVKILGTDKDDFSILSGGSATVLNSFESLSTAIRFMPGIPGRKKARIVFEHSGAESPSKIFLYGFASIPRIDTAIIAISDAHASAGDIIEIPIYYRKAPIFPIEAPDSLSVTLKFNASLLEPLFGAASDTIINGFRTLIFTVPARDSILKILKFSVGFGNDSISSLELWNIFPIGKWKSKIYIESGLFRLDGLCRDGGTRLFDPDGFISLAQNKPNPFQKTTIIEFDVLEPGKTRLYLINSMGNIERTILDSYLASGKYQIELNSDGLASGLYFYILETPSRRISRKLLIEK